MIIKPKSFTKSYAYGPFLQYKIEWEISMEEGEDNDTALMAAQKMSDDWHKKNTANMWDQPEGMTGATTRNVENNNEVDLEFEKLVSHLETFEFQEDAQVYLETTPFKFAMAAKAIVNRKPKKS